MSGTRAIKAIARNRTITLLAIVAGLSTAQAPAETTPIREATLDPGAIAFDGETLAIGNPDFSGPAGARQGAASIHTRENGEWTQQAFLTAADAAPDDHFGSYIAIDATTLAVSSKFGIYVFTRTDAGWTQQQKIVVDAGTTLVGPLGLSGDRIAAVTRVHDPDNQNDSYDRLELATYHRDAGVWTPEQVLASELDDYNFFYPPLLRADWLVLPVDIDATVARFRLFNRHHTNPPWQKFARPGLPDFRDDYGFGADLEGDQTVLFAHDPDGALILFHQWSTDASHFIQELHAADLNAPSAPILTSVSLNGDLVALGGYERPPPDGFFGVVYLLRRGDRNLWHAGSRFVVAENAAIRQVILRNNFLATSTADAVYVYRIEEHSSDNDNSSNANDNAAGSGNGNSSTQPIDRVIVTDACGQCAPGTLFAAGVMTPWMLVYRRRLTRRHRL